MNISSKIRIKAIGIYIILGVAIIGLLFLLLNLRMKIGDQKESVKSHRYSLELTSQLISKVEMNNFYVNNYNLKTIKDYNRNLIEVDSLISLLMLIEPYGKDNLEQISALIGQQKSNMVKFRRLIGSKNPMDISATSYRTMR